jgi:hypothetical protein
VGERRRRVVLLGRQPGLRYQTLGSVSAEHDRRSSCEALVQLRAALIDADAVIDARPEARYLLTRTVRRLTGVAIRAVDPAGRFELLARWLSERTAAVGARVLLLNAAGAVVMAVEGPSPPGRAGALLLMVVAMAYAWPLALAAGLRWPRRPQLLGAAAVATFGWGVALMAGRFLGAFALSTPEPANPARPWTQLGWADVGLSPTRLAYKVFGTAPRWLPQDVTETLVAPWQLVLALVLMVAHLILAGRCWRVRSDFRAVQESSLPGGDDSPPSPGLEPLLVAVSVVLSLVFAAVPGFLVVAARG